MPFTAYPRGVSSFGIPLLSPGHRLSIPNKNGKVWFVDKDNGGDGNSGNDPNSPYATIQKAIDVAGDGTGDTIVIYRGATSYTENLTVNKNKLSLIGASRFGNSKRVTVAPASGIAADFTAVLSPYVYGIRFAGTSNFGVRNAAEGGLFEECDFYSDTTHGFVFKASLVTADFTGSGTTILHSIFRECGGAGIQVDANSNPAQVNYGIQATNVQIIGNEFYLNTDDDINDDAELADGTYFSQWRIFGNFFMTRNKATYLDLNGGTGSTELMVAGNYFNDDAGLNATKIQLPAGGVFVGNYQAAGIVDGSTF